MTRVLIVAAHPDDETIGASAILGGPHEVSVMHVTDGAPRDARWWPVPVATRAAYAALRRAEAVAALATVGITTERIHELGFVDQDACRALPELVAVLADRLTHIAPDVIMTHAYEGGHPDHDAVAFAVAAACAWLSPPPTVLEMALYHGGTGQLAVGDFLQTVRGAVTRKLTADERARRRSMIECFATQHVTLAPFVELARERYRPAPAYDFTRPPHPGLLLYERWGLPITAAEWRFLASRVHERHAR